MRFFTQTHKHIHQHSEVVAMMLWMNSEWAVNAQRMPEWKHEYIFFFLLKWLVPPRSAKPFCQRSAKLPWIYLISSPPNGAVLQFRRRRRRRRVVLILMFYKSFLHQGICWEICSSFWFPLVIQIGFCMDGNRQGSLLPPSRSLFHFLLFDVLICMSDPVYLHGYLKLYNQLN